MNIERWIYALKMRLRSVFQREGADRELDEELGYHVEMKTEENMAKGMTRDQARRAALIDAGGIDQAKEKCRETRGVNWINDLAQDLRFGLRMMRNNPGFTAVAVLTLALGIGANTAIFSVIDAVMLKTLPVRNPQQLALLDWTSHADPDTLVQSLSGWWTHDGTGGMTCTSFSYPIYEQIAARNQVFSSLTAVAGNGSELNVSYNGQPGRADGQLVSGTFFSTLGVQPVIGRALGPDDDRAEASPAAVISYGYWQQRFGGDSGIAGRAINVNGLTLTIVGVSAAGFYGIQPGRAVDVWLPLHLQPQVEPRWSPAPRVAPNNAMSIPVSLFDSHDDWWVLLIGRLKQGTSDAQASADLGVILQQAIAGDVTPSTKAESIPHAGLMEGSRGLDYSRRRFSKPLFVLMIVVGLVLLIACINIASLLLVRGTSRQKEIAVRLAVGARRTRLVRQLLTESVLLAGFGGVAGLVLAFWGTDLLMILIQSGNESLHLNVAPDLRVFGFTAAASALAGVLFGLSPALRATRVELTPSLKESAGETAAMARGRTRLRLQLSGALVVAQVSLSLVLLVGAGLFVRTLANLEHVDAGFDEQNLLLFGIDPTQDGYKGERLTEFYRQLTQRIEALPGVRGVSVSRSTLIGGGGNFQLLRIQGYTPKHGEPSGAAVNWVGPKFLETLGIPLVLGREINEGDTATGPRVAVVNEQFARQFFGGGDPIGRRFTRGLSKDEIEIVGMTRNSKFFDLRGDAPATLYLPWVQYPDLNGAMHFEVRTAGNPTALVGEVRRVAQDMDGNLALYGVKSQMEQVDQSLFQERLFAQLTSFFGALAAVLASIGLYGLMAFAVSRRTREIGIRMALGASRREIAQMVMRETFALLGVGIAIGIAAALGASRLIASLLYGVAPTDPYTCIAVSFLLAIVALLACYVPARRAMCIDPMSALRHE
jgi:predicted permease